MAADIEDWRQSLLYDPQTSGGLLVAVDPAAVAPLRTALAASGIVPAIVGQVAARGDYLVGVRNGAV